MVGSKTWSTAWTTPLQASISVKMISGMASIALPIPVWYTVLSMQIVVLFNPFAISIDSPHTNSALVIERPSTAW